MHMSLERTQLKLHMLTLFFAKVTQRRFVVTVRLLVLTLLGVAYGFRCKPAYVVLDFFSVLFLLVVQGGRFPVQRVRGVGVHEKLRQEGVKNVGELEHGSPRLVDHVQTNGAGSFIDVRMEYFVHETDGRRPERVAVWNFNFHVPNTSFVNGVFGTFKLYKKFI